MASWLIRIAPSPGKSSRRRRATRSGLQAAARRRGCRGPCRRPSQDATGPGIAVPLGLATDRARRSCTQARNAMLAASFAGFGRPAARSQCRGAVVARCSSPPQRVAALRRRSRETVDADRLIRRATSRAPRPCPRRTASASRSANERRRPQSGFADR